jgi:hypothetical protein
MVVFYAVAFCFVFLVRWMDCPAGYAHVSARRTRMCQGNSSTAAGMHAWKKMLRNTPKRCHLNHAELATCMPMNERMQMQCVACGCCPFPLHHQLSCTCGVCVVHCVCCVCLCALAHVCARRVLLNVGNFECCCACVGYPRIKCMCVVTCLCIPSLVVLVCGL